jgi:uncharacterized repeat protein (TIGR03803 family)
MRLLKISALALLAIALAPAQHAQAWTYKVLHTFCSYTCYDGADPSGGLVLDSAGSLYGTTAGGTFFRLAWNVAKARWDERTLYNFCCEEGGPVSGRLVLDTAGNFYGVTPDGGARGAGTVFRLAPSANGKRWSLTRLYDFCIKDTNCPDGEGPNVGLTYAGAESGTPYDGVSPLYGATNAGGNFHNGTVFSLSPAPNGKWKLKALYSFCKQTQCTKGVRPSGLIADGNGNLYLAAQLGGKILGGGGTILKLSATDSEANRHTEPLYRFCTLTNCIDGAQPVGVVSDATGAVFGGTNQGGATNMNCRGGTCGVLYRLAPDGSETVLYSFCHENDCMDGSLPNGALTLDASGNLFGVTYSGGNSVAQNSNGYGTVFAFSGGSLQTLYNFCSQANCTDGSYPAGPLVMDASGNLFGEASSGGDKPTFGVVFELSP